MATVHARNLQNRSLVLLRLLSRRLAQLEQQILVMEHAKSQLEQSWVQLRLLSRSLVLLEQ